MDGLSALESPTPFGVSSVEGPGTCTTTHPRIVLDRLHSGHVAATRAGGSGAFGFTQCGRQGDRGALVAQGPALGHGGALRLQLVEGVESLDALAVPMLVASSHASWPFIEAAPAWPCAWVMGHEGRVCPNLDAALRR